MGYVDAHGIPKHLKQPAFPCQGNLTPSTGTLLHSVFLGKEKPKEISGWQPLALSSSHFPHLLFPSLFSPFYLFWTVSFIPAGKNQNITVGYAQKSRHCGGKKKSRNRDAPLGSANLKTEGISACICIWNVHMCACMHRYYLIIQSRSIQASNCSSLLRGIARLWNPVPADWWPPSTQWMCSNSGSSTPFPINLPVFLGGAGK